MYTVLLVLFLSGLTGFKFGDFDGMMFLITDLLLTKGHAVAQLVKALRYKSEGRGFDSR
jgi:hypothetical protein